MKKNQMTGTLLGILLLSTLATAVLVSGWDYYYNRLRFIHNRQEEVQQASQVMQSLANESAEYARATGNKDLQALLNLPLGNKGHSSAPAPAKSGK